jgi:hypothetical protein
MAIHDQFHRRHARAALPEAIANALPAPVQTLVSVVYVTATPTFNGPVGGYTTVGVAADPTTAAASPKNTAQANTQQANTQTTTAQAKASQATQQQPSVEAQSPSTASVDTNTIATPTSDINSSMAAETNGALSSSDLPTAITTPTSSLASLASSVPILAATTALSSSQTGATHASSVSGTAAAASSSSTRSPRSSGGMSAGGKAGLAIGILLLVGAILALVLFCFKKRKDQQKQQLSDHEKQDPFADSLARQASVQTTRTNPNAPRLSLRPVTQFLPNLSEKRQSRGNALMTAAAPMSEKALRNERPMTPQADNRANPFGNHAETIDSANANGPAEVRVMSPTGEIVTAATGTPSSPPSAAQAPAGAGLARGASRRENGPKEMDFTKSGPFRGPPSPAGTEFSTSSDSTSSPAQTGTGAAIAAAGGPNSTVHRVQLDFKPSMDDELELRAGQLIRLLHEYDDGWVSSLLMF